MRKESECISSCSDGGEVTAAAGFSPQHPHHCFPSPISVHLAAAALPSPSPSSDDNSALKTVTWAYAALYPFDSVVERMDKYVIIYRCICALNVSTINSILRHHRVNCSSLSLFINVGVR